MEAWYEKFDYNRNPFYVRPDTVTFVGYQDIITDMVQGLVSEDLIVLTGDYGSGKTTLLRFISNNTGKPYTPLYFNAIDSPFDLDSLLLKKKSFIDRLFKLKYGKRDKVILFVDEFSALQPRDQELVKSKYDDGLFYSVVLCGNGVDSVPASILDRSVRMRMRPMKEKEAIDMIQKRLEGKPNPFTAEAMAAVVKLSAYNPRKILKNCEELFRKVFTLPEIPAFITPEVVAQLLGASPSAVAKPTVDTLVKEREEVKARLPFIVAEAEQAKPKSGLWEKLSPLQRDILTALGKGRLDYSALAEAVGKPRDTVAKQVSRLCLASDADYMSKRGISRPLLRKDASGSVVKLELTDFGREAIA
jgi:hypothetical protein